MTDQATSAKAPHRTLGLAECRLVLEEVRNQLGQYDQMWNELRPLGPNQPRPSIIRRVKARLSGNVTFEQSFGRLRKDVDPSRPFFIGQIRGGVRFLGDARDYPCALHAIDPDCNSTIIQALCEAAQGRSGNVVDVGTNIGVVAVSLAKAIGSRGVVHAFEPSPDTLRLAACTIALNEVSNILLHHAAVSDTDGSITFQSTPGNSAIASARKHEFAHLNEWGEITVPACRLDTLFESGELGRVGLIKIDVEGHELHALRGAQGLITAEKPDVVFEYTPVAASSHGWTQQDSVRVFEACGAYGFEALSEVDGLKRPFPLDESYRGQVNVFAKPRD